MKRRNFLGQEAIEFILITALVFFGALMVMLTFSSKIAAFFETDSSVAKVANNTIAVVNPDAPVQYTPDYETKASNDNNKQLYDDYQTQLTEETTTAADTKTIAGLDVDFNADGSASFTVGSQQVDLSAELLNLQDLVMETSGSAGATDLVKEIAYMIQKNEAAYPPGEVPVEISYGTGNRDWNEGNAYYKGKAVVNTTSIKVGNNLVILQNDQDCSGTCTFKGKYRMEGTIGANNKFNANVTSDTYYNARGTYSATVDIGNGINFKNSYYHQKDNYNTTDISYTWDMGFAEPTSL